MFSEVCSSYFFPLENITATNRGWFDIHFLVFIQNSSKIGILIVFVLAKDYHQVTAVGRQMQVVEV
jgi:hypothetical protein